MSHFVIEGEGLDAEALAKTIEQRVGKEPTGAAPVNDQPKGAVDLFSELLRSLADNADSTQGFPPQSHRSFGSAVVAAKKGFRLAFQPLINDALSRQTLFNHRLLDALAALRTEQRTLEARLDRLEKRKGERK